MDLGSLWLFIGIFAIMYFFIIRPQREQMKRHQEMLAALRRGDRVVTGGGLIGKVVKIHDASDEVEVEISPGVVVPVVRSTLTEVRAKTTPLTNKEPAVNKAEATQHNSDKNIEKRQKPTKNTKNTGAPNPKSKEL